MTEESAIHWDHLGLICLMNPHGSSVERCMEALRVAAGVSVWQRVGIRILMTHAVGRLLELAMEEDFEVEEQAVRLIRILRDLHLGPWMLSSVSDSASALIRRDLWERIEPEAFARQVKRHQWVQRWT